MSSRGSKGIGTGRIVLAVLLLVLAVCFLVASVAPSAVRISGDAVSLPDFFLAVGASAAVAAVFFFLSAELKRAEKRTDDAISGLRQEVSSLKEELQLRAAKRRAAADQAARNVVGAEDVGSLIELSSAAADRGFGSTLCVALGGRRQLSFVTLSGEGPTGPTQRMFMLGVEELPEHVVDPHEPSLDPVAWSRRQQGVVEVDPEGRLADSLDSLRVQLERNQASWAYFPDDAERALNSLSEAMSALLRTEEVDIGVIEVVLDERHVLTRSDGDQRLVIDVERLDEPWPVTSRLAEKAELPSAPPVLKHPLVARHLSYQRNAARQAQDLRERKRATRAIHRGSRPGR